MITLTTVVAGQTVNGVAGNDVIAGSNGADVINGGDGTDTIWGGIGNDILYGGQSADTLNGGVGYDIFRFGSLTEISGLAEKLDGGVDDDRLDFATGNLSGTVNLSLATLTSVEALDSRRQRQHRHPDRGAARCLRHHRLRLRTGYPDPVGGGHGRPGRRLDQRHR